MFEPSILNRVNLNKSLFQKNVIKIVNNDITSEYLYIIYYLLGIVLRILCV